MEEMQKLLLDLGINLGSQVIYDVAKNYFASTPAPTKEGLKEAIRSLAQVNGVEVKAEKIIEFLAKNGDIEIKGSSIFAKESIAMISAKDTALEFANGSESSTENTKIAAGLGASIRLQGGARIDQDPDGSIRFSV